MEVDYLFAVGIFVAIFAFAVLFVSNNVMEQKEDIRLKVVKENADLLMNRMMDGNISLSSPMYRLFVYAENSDSIDVNELVFIDLNRFGKNDPNSVIVYDNDGVQYNYSVSANTIVFSSIIQANSKKMFVVYFDDDSNFTTVNNVIEGNNSITEQVYGPEKIHVIQEKLIQRMQSMNYEDTLRLYELSGFQISVVDRNDMDILEFGSLIDGRKNVVIRKKPVLIQNRGSLREGWLIINAWS